MTAPAIKVDGIGKLYKLQHAAAGSRSFRELLTDLVHAPIRRFRELSGSEATLEDFWALRDVSFEVQPGEVVGIIGRNGAGKRTLLKILSRIVEPSCGQVTMQGRVASLLEVGTGFHPELSGRENIYLNGSILGMKKREIDARFDEIVAFAEIERFLDTPVKRYSSGMYVRLAFGVAAHLDPEILIVDEVLAVGDAEFQKRCLGKMKEISTSGHRTVLFVSHNMSAIRSLCSRGVLLKRGGVAMLDTAHAVVDSYMSPGDHELGSSRHYDRPSGARIWIKQARVLANGMLSSTVPMGAKVTLEVEFETEIPIRRPGLGYVIATSTGDRVIHSNNRFQPSPSFDVPRNSGVISCELGSPPLMPGRYAISLWLGDEAGDHHIEPEAVFFEVIERDLWGLGQLPPPAAPMWWPTEFPLSALPR
jgi:lipopolysaccharide transport system ATP-binding protein